MNGVDNDVGDNAISHEIMMATMMIIMKILNNDNIFYVKEGVLININSKYNENNSSDEDGNDNNVDDI